MREKTTGRYDNHKDLVDDVWFHKFGTDSTHRMIAAMCCVSAAAVTRALNHFAPRAPAKEKIAAALAPGYKLGDVAIRLVDKWEYHKVKTLEEIAYQIGIQPTRLEGQLTKYRSTKGDQTMKRRLQESRQILAEAQEKLEGNLIEDFEAICCMIEETSLPENTTAIQRYLGAYKTAAGDGYEMIRIPHPKEFAGYLPDEARVQFEKNITKVLGGLVQ